jgi:hypothetical protein
MPEWMIDIPKDLHGGWFVVARPEGKHCLVISSNGTTVARDRAGRLLHRFQSLLPNGSARSSYGANDYCILDCVMNDDLETIFVVDVICWKGQTMYESSAEFRLFWAQSRIGEVAGLADKVPGVNDFSMSVSILLYTELACWLAAAAMYSGLLCTPCSPYRFTSVKCVFFVVTCPVHFGSACVFNSQYKDIYWTS